MIACPRCGLRNPPEQKACSQCGNSLGFSKQTTLGLAPPDGSAAASLGGTLLMDGRKSAPPARPGSKPPVAKQSAGPPLRGTMIGLSPPSGSVPPAATTPSDPPPADLPAPGLRGTMIGIAPPTQTDSSPPTPAPAAEATRAALRGTMIGIGMPASSSSPPPPQAAGATGDGGLGRTALIEASPPTQPGPVSPTASLASGTKTVLGVALPGIAPLNPGQAKTAPVPPGAEPDVIPALTATGRLKAEADAFAAQVRRARVPTLAAAALVGAAALLAAVGVIWFLYRGHGSIEARVDTDNSGRDLLILSCAQCDNGTAARLDAAEAKFLAGHASLPVTRTLHIGENPVLLSLVSPTGKRDSVELNVPLEYRVRGDMSGINADPPELRVLVNALPGSSVVVDGKPLALDHDGKATFHRDISSLLTGAEPTVQRLEQHIKYSVTAPGAPKAGYGEVVLESGITPLVIEAPGPSVVVEGPDFVLSGRTVKGGTMSVAGKPISVDPSGRFVQLMNISAPGETTITLRASVGGQAPRLFPLHVRRVESLAREAEQLRQRSIADYAAIAEHPEGKRGASVALDGTTVEASADDYASIIVMDVKSGCAHAPCLARIRYGARSGLTSGDAFSVFGELLGAVEGPHSGTQIPEIRADFLLKGQR